MPTPGGLHSYLGEILDPPLKWKPGEGGGWFLRVCWPKIYFW